MDLIQGGELFDEVVRRGHFSEKDAAIVIKQVLSVIHLCHEHGIMHCDLKPENILLENPGSLDQIKVIDFGQAKASNKNAVLEHLSETCGTGYYQAPEVLKGDYGKECDIWSTGVITYILLSGLPPFNGNATQIK